MSVQAIDGVITRLAEANPQEELTIPPGGVAALISAATGDGHVSAAERAELLYALVHFDTESPGYQFAPNDAAAVKTVILRGMKSAVAFAERPTKEQAQFVRACVIYSDGEFLGFRQRFVSTRSLPRVVREIVPIVLVSGYMRAGETKYHSARRARVYALERSGETYCFILYASYDARDESGAWDLAAYIAANAGATHLLYGSFNLYDPED